jgi:glycosyltransferase involved in cell wall biosynthesis
MQKDLEVDMQSEVLSFIIPAFNEEENIANTLEMIKKHVPEVVQYEIIVIDHDSTDDTFNLAKKNGARVFKKRDGTVAALRNFGVKMSTGDVFVFIDADVVLTKEWNSAIHSVLNNIRSGNRIITGSWVCVPDQAGWIERYWFEPLQTISNTHVNSGHMLISRKLFDELSGFDENLETGEDFDISMRAKTLDIQVVENLSLKVVHIGYPKSLWEFIVREYWHGKGDATSVYAIARSKVAVTSLIYIALHAIAIISWSISYNTLMIYSTVLLIILLCVGVSATKYKLESVSVIGVNSILYYFYFFARSSSLLAGMFRRKMKKRQR